MTKRKRQTQNSDSLKKIRTDVIDFSFNNSLTNDSSISISLSNTRKHTQSRKQKRKEERLLKKARKDAFSQRKAIPTKEDFIKAKELIALDEQKEIQIKRKKEQRKREKKERKKQKQKKKRKEEEKKVQDEEELDAVKKRDNQEIQDLEKKLHLNKRKSKALPQSFLDDGLDYLLDVVDADKLASLADADDESDLENEFKEIKQTTYDEGSLDEFESNLDDEKNSDESFNEDDEENFYEDTDDDNEAGDDNEMDNEGNVDKATKPGKVEKWEKLAEKIQLVVKSSKKTKSIIKERKTIETHLKQEQEKEQQNKGKKHVSFADDPVEESSTSSEPSSSVENTDTESLLSDDRNKTMDFPETPGVGDILGVEPDDHSEVVNVEDAEVKEDIYGRLRDSKGNIIKDIKGIIGGTSGTYIPPAKRALMIAGTDEKRKLHLDKLRKQMKGLVNRASEANMQSVCSQLEELYLSNSRADVNETLVSLVFDLCVTMEITPERLAMEMMMLVALLHGNVGSEVGAHFLQNLVKKFDMLRKGPSRGMDKELDNVVLLLSHLYNFKVVHRVLMFDILKSLTDTFLEKEVELILLIVKTIGFSLRKDDPAGLKELILSIQTRATSNHGTAMRDESRVRFMLDILMAIRNNNIRKIPNYDPEHLQHLQRMMKGFLRGGEFGDNQLHVTLQDLINAENKGKWWIVGSAWEGQGPKQAPKESHADGSIVLQGVEISSKLQELAKKQRMNTDKRRTIFYVIMTSEDYIDAFEKLLRMGLKANQQQEIVIVILDCCLQEKTYNPFYAFLAQKLCEHHRSYQMSFQFSIWDRFKTISELSESNRYNFGKLLSHLIIQKALSLSILKVVEFGTVQKSMVRLLKQLLTELLTDYPLEQMQAVFTRIAPLVKLKKLHEGLKLFMHHFLIGRDRGSLDSNPLLRERLEMVDQIMSVSKGHML